MRRWEGNVLRLRKLESKGASEEENKGMKRQKESLLLLPLSLALLLCFARTAQAATYYLAPAGPGVNDSPNDGSSGHPWLTPNHNLNCGDVIIAAPSSSYSGDHFTTGNWGNVACSPGDTANVAWLKCATFDACKITVSSDDNSFYIDKSYWGVQGWEVDGNNNGDCFAAQPSPVNPFTVHHVIFANNIANNCGVVAFGSSNLYQSTTASADYLVVVGNIAYNSASANVEFCGNSISFYEPILSDTNSGTHFLVAGNFTYDNVDNPACAYGSPTDGEGIILDTFNGSAGGITPYAGQTVIENNISIFNGSRGIWVLQDSAGSIYIKQNTTYGNNTDTHMSSFCGEIGANVVSGNVSISGNITATSGSHTGNGSPWYDYIMGGSDTSVQITSGIAYDGPGGGNYCNSIDGGSFSCNAATLTFLDPGFPNPMNPGAPNCGGKSSVPDCMAAVIAGYTPANPAAKGYGYQIPSTTPAFDPLFPKWLCNVTLPPGLVTMGCASSSPSACDVNKDGFTNVADVQGEVNQALGSAPCANDINQDGVCNVIDVQLVVNAALGGTCVAP